MTITRFFLAIRIFLLATLLFPSPSVLLAQAPLVCDPLPTDPDLILECNFQDLGNYPGKTYEPGTDPSNPTVFPADGVGGIAGAYADKTDLVLIASGKFVSDSNRQIVGIMADPRTAAPKSAAFRIDSSGMAGVPKVAYSADLEKFLVVWEDGRPCGASCRSAYGRFVSADGKVIGTDFAINQTPAFLAGVVYDSVNKKFVVSYEGNGVFFRTVTTDGTVSAPFKLPSHFLYQGQMGLAVNTALNEYWIAYATVVGAADTAQEDDRVYYSRVDAKTLQVVGEPVQLSQTRPGRLAVQSAHIDYSTTGGGAMVIWNEGGREGVSGIWGRTVYDDGTLSDEYPVITVGINPVSEGFGNGSITYNRWTESFFVPSGDWSGNAWITEIDLGGLIYESTSALSAKYTAGSSFFAKLFGIKTASAAATGSFNITAIVTPYGAITLASQNYQNVVANQYSSPNAPGPAQPPVTSLPPTPSNVDVTALPKLINQIYVWGLGISVLLALLMMVLGGYYIMTAGGNAEQSSKGKEFITSSLIGVAIIFTAYLLLNQINPDLVNFNLSSLTGLNR